MLNANDHKYRLGYYQVGNQKIINKSKALIEATRLDTKVNWVFNDSVYSKFNWSIPVNVPLSELYKIRAQQLRDQYDHLMLYYSGGADSTNVLHSFIDNNIFIDEIVMQYPKPIESTMNNVDTDNNNYFSEIKYAAIVHLDKIKPRLDPRTKIRILDQAADTTMLFEKEDWFEKFPLGTMITPAATGRQISAIIDPELDKLYTLGKTVCQIYGVDKPIVNINQKGEYYAYFLDANATHAVPTGYDLGDLANKFFFMEFFYWTPDLPEIVIKQAQEIKKAAEADTNIKFHLANSALHIEKLRSVIHPIIYCAEANLNVFQTSKPNSNVYRPMDKWFWLPEFKQAQNNYLNVIKYLGDSINPIYFTNGNVYDGLTPIRSLSYKL